MTLATHIVVGAAGAKIFATNPIQGFIIGWLSHYILDFIIHWDYPLSVTKTKKVQFPEGNPFLNKEILIDVSKVIVDALLGFIIVYLFLRDGVQFFNPILFAGALGGTIPDFLQFLYAIRNIKLVGVFQKFHNFMHAQRDFSTRPILGISIQLILIFVILVLFNG